MPLILIGLGLGDERDITVRGLEAARSADVVFIEAYTAILADATRLEAHIGRPIVTADRTMVESGEVIKDVESKRIALLVVGDPFGATTHSDLVVRCHELNVPVEVVHNASIMNAVGCCGLQLYRFGQTISLCFWTETWRPSSWYDKLVANRVAGLHTLTLLDIKVKEVSDANLARGRMIFEPPRFMTARQGAEQLLEVARERGDGIITENTVCVALGRVGAPDQKIVVATLRELASNDYLGAPLHSLVVAGDIHTCETEHVRLFNKNHGAVDATAAAMAAGNGVAPTALCAHLEKALAELAAKRTATDAAPSS